MFIFILGAVTTLCVMETITKKYQEQGDYLKFGVYTLVISMIIDIVIIGAFTVLGLIINAST